MIEYIFHDQKIDRHVIIKVGESAEENWKLLKSSSQKDIWFHLDKHSSPYVIIKNDFKNHMSMSTLKYAAMLCKSHSKMKNVNKVNVIYTQVKNLKKGKEVGSVIANKTKKLSI